MLPGREEGALSTPRTARERGSRGDACQRLTERPGCPASRPARHRHRQPRPPRPLLRYRHRELEEHSTAPEGSPAHSAGKQEKGGQLHPLRRCRTASAHPPQHGSVTARPQEPQNSLSAGPTKTRHGDRPRYHLGCRSPQSGVPPKVYLLPRTCESTRAPERSVNSGQVREAGTGHQPGTRCTSQLCLRFSWCFGWLVVFLVCLWILLFLCF